MLLLSLLAAVPLLANCREERFVPANLEAAALGRLAERRILFAHQSVGADILTGIGERFADQPVPLRIARLSDLPEAGGFFAHETVGGNGDALGKLRDFSRIVAAGTAKGTDTAIFKFCYLDLPAGTDVLALFQAYRAQMDEIAASYPHLRLLHCTVPLTRRQTGPKAWMKRLLGRPVTGVEDNMVRARFNGLLRRTYGDAVFDLAAVESTWPDGRREIVTHDGAAAYALVPVYTDDDGHLNLLGRRIVAERFLAFILAR